MKKNKYKLYTNHFEIDLRDSSKKRGTLQAGFPNIKYHDQISVTFKKKTHWEDGICGVPGV